MREHNNNLLELLEISDLRTFAGLNEIATSREDGLEVVKQLLKCYESGTLYIPKISSIIPLRDRAILKLHNLGHTNNYIARELAVSERLVITTIRELKQTKLK
jgi:Mor family transcriptional regulator